jgi:hypothetical protein
MFVFACFTSHQPKAVRHARCPQLALQTAAHPMSPSSPHPISPVEHHARIADYSRADRAGAALDASQGLVRLADG